MEISISKNKKTTESHEIVERKGKGHPDTLSDGLAEYLSVKYSNYTKDLYGAVLHHNFDKVGLLGGAVRVKFGEGVLTKPIRVLLNGRASTSFGNKEIPIQSLLESWAAEFLVKELPLITADKDLEFHYNLTNKSSPGNTDNRGSEDGTRKYWFEPRNLNDLQETKKLLSNDTSIGVGYYPLGPLEHIVFGIERLLNSDEYKKTNQWLGTDIKILGYRENNDVYLTMCLPQIANYVNSADEYRENLQNTEADIRDLIKNMDSVLSLKGLYINTRDNYNSSELYLTAIGSSIESGDEGLVGRGNRINGLISPLKPMAMEGACGKNPVYHIGKVYYVAAQQISEKIYNEFNLENELILMSQSGRELNDPWKVFLQIDDSSNVDEEALEAYLRNELNNISHFTEGILNSEYHLC